MPDLDHKFFADVYDAEDSLWVAVIQPCFVGAQDRITGELLDIGCGSGDHARYFSRRGCKVVGIDFVEAAIERAKKNAADEGLSIDFRVGSALELGALSDRFDNAIDSGLFHVLPLDGEDRYASGMHSVLRPGGRLFLLGFSDAEPGTHGPKRLTRAHLERVFANGWTIESIEPSVLETVGHHKDAQGLFAVIRRD